MTVEDLAKNSSLTLLTEGLDLSTEITKPFCCDLLSIAMSRGIENAAWVTVMGNVNTLAVMSLTDMACIILAEGASMDEAGMARARQEGIALMRTQEGIFPASLKVWNLLQKG